MYKTMYSIGRTKHIGVTRGKGYPEDTITIGKYKVQIDETDKYYELFIWNPDIPCLMMMLDKEEKVAVLEMLEYDSRCTIDHNMQHGKDTKDMILFAFETMKAHGATRVELMDKATILCNGKKVRLGIMYFLKYGMTWYESAFGFRPTEKYIKRYENAKRKRIEKLDVEVLRQQPCDFFADDDAMDEILEGIKLTFFDSISWEKIL
jgi:hypothetical protein